MNKALVIFGFLFLGVELFAGIIYGLTLVPWTAVAGLLTDRVLAVIFAILWNIAAGTMLWAGYKD
jgi:hypothetical protein